MAKENGSSGSQRGENRERARAGGTGSNPVYRQIRVVGLAVVLPFIMVIGPVAGYFAGYWIGDRFGLGPWTRIVGIGIGTVVAVQQTVQIIRRLVRELR